MTDKPKPRWGGAPSTKCEKCKKTLYPAETMKMEGRLFHINCLRCSQCDKKLSGDNWGSFVQPQDEPYCKMHYDRLVMSLGGDTTQISGSTARQKS